MNMSLPELILALEGAKLAAEIKGDIALNILLQETISYLEKAKH